MDFIDRFERSWRIIQASVAVLKQERQLLILPLLSGIATAIVGGAMVWQAFDYGTFPSPEHPEFGFSGQINFYVWLFAFYLVQYFIIIFFNTALVGAAIERLDGGDPTLGWALRLAARRIGPIFGYAIISATVGVLLRALAERTGIIGKLIAGGLGLAWTVVTFLVVPVLAAEGVGPVEAVSRSAGLLRKTWGENLIGNAGISIVFGSLTAIIVLVGYGGGTVLSMRGYDTAGLVLMIAGMVALIPVVLVGATLSGIFSAALYYFAMLGKPPEGFDGLMKDAFAKKA